MSELKAVFRAASFFHGILLTVSSGDVDGRSPQKYKNRSVEGFLCEFTSILRIRCNDSLG